MFNEHKKFPKIRGFHNVVKEVKYLRSEGVIPVMKFRPKIKLHGCVDANTLVTMHDGSSKKISEISSGEKIISLNEKSGLIEEDVVTDVISQDLDKEWFEIAFSNGKKINCTIDHPIYTRNRGYVKAYDLNEKDIFYEDFNFVAKSV